MSKIIFDLHEIKELLKEFEVVVGGSGCCGDNGDVERIVYDVDENGYIYAKRYFGEDLDDERYEEFIQGEIIAK